MPRAKIPYWAFLQARLVGADTRHLGTESNAFAACLSCSVVLTLASRLAHKGCSIGELGETGTCFRELERSVFRVHRLSWEGQLLPDLLGNES